METQTWLSCHNKFISAENITILSVLSNDFLHAVLEVADSKCGICSYVKKNSQVRAEGFKTVGIRKIKKQKVGLL